MKTKLVKTLLAMIVTVAAGLPSPAMAGAHTRTWSIAVHIQYPDGFVYDHAFATGVPTSELSATLSACGQAHKGGSAVQYHCYAIPE